MRGEGTRAACLGSCYFARSSHSHKSCDGRQPGIRLDCQERSHQRSRHTTTTCNGGEQWMPFLYMGHTLTSSNHVHCPVNSKSGHNLTSSMLRALLVIFP